MRRTVLRVAIVLLAAWALTLPLGAEEQVIFQVRDAMTGHLLSHARARIEDPVTKIELGEARADGAGRLELVVPPKAEAIAISAEGYEGMSIPAPAAKSPETTNTVWLAPAEPPEELRTEVIAARRLPGTTMLHGHAIDVAGGRPLAGARVYLDAGQSSTTTDERGYFLLYAKGSRVLDPEDVPDFDDLIVEMPGFVRARLAHVPMLEQDMHFIVDLEPGRGEEVRNVSHKMFPEGIPLKHADPALLAPAKPAPEETTSAGTGLPVKPATGGLDVRNPPNQINVSGYGWYDLDTYVTRGLCAEWISSWGTHALDAGAVAYRTYGSYWQLNYGYICATTSCQVFNNSYVQKCADAAQRTSGIVLEKNGNIAFSEYSAENNSYYCAGWSCVNTDLSCGYGYAGSPAAGWSCLADSHYFDQGPGACCYGHGHGMCQWGTHAWSRAGKKWNWMVDHYYNDFGSGTGNRTMLMTTPLEFTAATPSPSNPNAGTTFTINATVRSYADYNHTRLMLGAKLTGPGTLTDSSNDTKVTVLGRSGEYRDTNVSRSFYVQGSAATGTYDLVVQLWYDSDNDSVIDGTDKLLHEFTNYDSVDVNGGGGGGGECPGWSQMTDDSDSADVYWGGPSEYWWEVTGYGYNNQMHYTWNVATPGEATNFIYWYFDVPENYNYKVEVFIPRNHATTTNARYYVHDGSNWHGPYIVNQNTKYDEWVTLTSSIYLQEGRRIVYTGDYTGETSYTKKLGVDAARVSCP